MKQKGVLNWKQYFKNQNLLTDALKFQEWDKQNLDITEKQTLIKDLTRTRNDDPYFKKETTQKNLQLLATFYCQQNSVDYQQGMLEIVVPFLLLKNKEFPLSKCYAYYNSFMNLYFPKFLEQKAVGQNKELAHVLSAIQFCEILIKYHCADFYSKLMQIEEFNLSMVITQFLMTLFAKGTPIPLVYVIFDQFMQRNNPNYVFYMAAAFLDIKKEKINQLWINNKDGLLPFLNKDLKNLTSEDDVLSIFQIADQLFITTPQSFDNMIEQTSFHDKSILSVEEIKDLCSIGTNLLSQCLYIFCPELVSQCFKHTQNIQNNKQFQLYLIDIRDEKKRIKLSHLVNDKKIIIKKKYLNKLNQDVHYCIVVSSKASLQKGLDLVQQLIMSGQKHISILKGGEEEITLFIKKYNKGGKDGCILM
ncbi:hypothetical protein pb186bvf_011366 [Paramecium bursaria]